MKKSDTALVDAASQAGISSILKSKYRQCASFIKKLGGIVVYVTLELEKSDAIGNREVPLSYV